jgi:enamine deaminase RidA (YjgF/YER057c/UK114 family)
MDGVETTVALVREMVLGRTLHSAMSWLPADHTESSVSQFTSASGLTEWHVCVGVSSDDGNPAKALEARWQAALAGAGIDPTSTVLRRVFCSDVVNQRPSLENFARAYPGAFSAVGQPPLHGGRFSIWSYHIEASGKPLPGEGGGGCFSITRGTMQHAWLCGLNAPSSTDAATQCRKVLARHDEALSALGMSLGNDVMRTWWYLRDIDNDYQALVAARKEAFDRHELTPETHYIASTGIAGAPAAPTARLALDSYAISGLRPGQVEYLTAPDHLGPTQNYGVTFERATAVSYADRRHIFISGTASIDPSGAIVHPGDVLCQLDRAIENVAALLAAAGGGLGQLAMMLVYLRDPADGKKIGGKLRTRFPGLPVILVHAPVCRPGWLVEVEGIAILTFRDAMLPDF